MNRAVREWLSKEIPAWVDSGWIGPEAAGIIRRKYSLDSPGRPSSAGVTIMAVIGSLLISLGVISLLAHNWADLSRAARLAISFAPLIAAQGLAAFAIATGRASAAWREGVGVAWMLAMGACIAMVAQVYHIPGDAGAFTLTWMLLSIPIVYLLGSTLAAAGVWIGLLIWAAHEQSAARHALAFWPMAALLIPFTAGRTRAAPDSGRTAVLMWAAALTVLWGVGLTLERAMPGLWIIIYGSMLVLMAGSGGGAPLLSGFWRRPFATVGVAGVAILALVLSCEWPWDGIGWRSMRFGSQYSMAASALDYAAAIGLSIVAIARWGSSIARPNPVDALVGAATVLVILGFAAAGVSNRFELAIRIGFNIYAAALGATIVAQGIRAARPGIMNGGLAILAALIVMRFADDAIPFVVRGAVFVALGVAVLLVNATLARRMRREGARP